jgi:hypothetical protein
MMPANTKFDSGILTAGMKLGLSYGQMFQLLWQLYGEAQLLHLSWFFRTWAVWIKSKYKCKMLLDVT